MKFEMTLFLMLRQLGKDNDRTRQKIHEKIENEMMNKYSNQNARKKLID